MASLKNLILNNYHQWKVSEIGHKNIQRIFEAVQLFIPAMFWKMPSTVWHYCLGSNSSHFQNQINLCNWFEYFQSSLYVTDVCYSWTAFMDSLIILVSLFCFSYILLRIIWLNTWKNIIRVDFLSFKQNTIESLWKGPYCLWLVCQGA